MSSMVKISNKEDITYLKINNPPVNALSLSLVDKINEAIDSLESTRVLVFEGSGRGLCAGADLKERSKMTDAETINTIDQYRDLFKKIENLSYPTIARIHGFALGGGLEFSLACDFRFAIKGSIIGLPETSIGIIPGAGGTQRLAKLIGISKAKDWIFTAKKVDARKAFKDNIIDQIFSDKAEMDTYIFELAMTISRNCEIAVAAAKKSINGRAIVSDFEYDLERREYIKTLDSNIRKQNLKRYNK